MILKKSMDLKATKNIARSNRFERLSFAKEQELEHEKKILTGFQQG